MRPSKTNPIKLLLNREQDILNFRLMFWKKGVGDRIDHPSTAYIKELIVLRLNSRYLISRDLRGQGYNRIYVKNWKLK